MMQPIHLAIGIVEGLVTAGIVSFLWKARPEILDRAATDQPLGALPLQPVLIGLALATLFTGGFLSWYASDHPDGLEWAMFKVSGEEDLSTPDNGVHHALEELQEKTAILPDYGFKSSAKKGEEAAGSGRIGTSLSGLVGGMLVLLLGLMIGLVLKKRGSGHPHPHPHPHA
jgi:cobalt/nickel transport system permease protein